MKSGMGISVDIACGQEKATVDKFRKIVQARLDILHETPKDAMVASAITVLRSIRARTKIYKGEGVRING